MFQLMRRAHKLLLLVAVCAGLTAAPAVEAATSAPTPAQIAAAIKAATASRALWATINRCDHSHDGVIGIRGQMPSLTFPARLLMVRDAV